MIFIFLLILGTFILATISGFFSVWGLAQTFHGVFWSVIAMGIALEYGKLITASFLYRYQHKISNWLKIYMTTAVIILMFITAIGHFGYLSLGYQMDSLPLKEIESKIELLKQEQTQLQERKKEIDKQIAELPTNYVKGRQRLMHTFAPELNHINSRLPQIAVEMQQLTARQITTQTHVGPIVYIAKAFNKEIDDATKWIIFLLIFVFDPLAVALTIGINVALKIREEEAEKRCSSDKLTDVSINNEDKSSVTKCSTDKHTSSLTPDEIKMIISEEIKNVIPQPFEHNINPNLEKLARRDEIISNLRTMN